MSLEKWTEVDRYITDAIVPSNPALDAALQNCSAAGLPAISVSQTQGKFLHLLAKIQGARRILEIGTLGGYSTIWLAQALPPEGILITLESEPKHANVALTNLANANLMDRVQLRLGLAIESLPLIAAEKGEPFDFIFIDADKPSNADYFRWALKLSRRGTIIIVDNVVRNGLVVDANSADLNVLGVRRLNELLAAEKRVSATTLQTVGAKGYDGFTLALVTADIPKVG